MLLTPDALETALRDLPGWTTDGHMLVRQYTFASFPDAVAFVTRLAFDAEGNSGSKTRSGSWTSQTGLTTLSKNSQGA